MIFTLFIFSAILNAHATCSSPSSENAADCLDSECTEQCAIFCAANVGHYACVPCPESGDAACLSRLPRCQAVCTTACASPAHGRSSNPNCDVCTPEVGGSYDACTLGTGTSTDRCAQDCAVLCILGTVESSGDCPTDECCYEDNDPMVALSGPDCDSKKTTYCTGSGVNTPYCQTCTEDEDVTKCSSQKYACKTPCEGVCTGGGSPPAHCIACSEGATAAACTSDTLRCREACTEFCAANQGDGACTTRIDCSTSPCTKAGCLFECYDYCEASGGSVSGDCITKIPCFDVSTVAKIALCVTFCNDPTKKALTGSLCDDTLVCTAEEITGAEVCVTTGPDCAVLCEAYCNDGRSTTPLCAECTVDEKASGPLACTSPKYDCKGSCGTACTGGSPPGYCTACEVAEAACTSDTLRCREACTEFCAANPENGKCASRTDCSTSPCTKPTCVAECDAACQVDADAACITGIACYGLPADPTKLDGCINFCEDPTKKALTGTLCADKLPCIHGTVSGAQACLSPGPDCPTACADFCVDHPNHIACQECPAGSTIAQACASPLPQCKAQCTSLCAEAGGSPPAACAACTPGGAGAVDACTPGATPTGDDRCQQDCAVGCIEGDIVSGCPDYCTLPANDPLLGLQSTAECATKRNTYCTGSGLNTPYCQTCEEVAAVDKCSSQKYACKSDCETACDGVEPAHCIACSVGATVAACTSDTLRCREACTEFCATDPTNPACTTRIDCSTSPCTKDGCLFECFDYCEPSGGSVSANCITKIPCYDLSISGNLALCETFCEDATNKALTGSFCADTLACTAAEITGAEACVTTGPDCGALCATFCASHPKHIACQECPYTTAPDIDDACSSPLPQCKAQCTSLCAEAGGSPPACAACNPGGDGAVDACTPGATPTGADRCPQDCAVACIDETIAGDTCPSMCSVDAVAAACASGAVVDCASQCEAYCTDPCSDAQKTACGEARCTAWCTVETNKENEKCTTDEEGALSVVVSLLLLIVALL